MIYPGKLTVADSFRIGCIGRLNAEHMRGALAAIREVLDELGVVSVGSSQCGGGDHEPARGQGGLQRTQLRDTEGTHGGPLP